MHLAFISIIIANLQWQLSANSISNFPQISFKAIPVSKANLPDENEPLPNNAPLLECGEAGGVQDGEYMDLVGQYMDPPCEEVQGYCRIKRNTNYTAVVRYIPKVTVQSFHVKTSIVQQYSGWETQFWPVFYFRKKNST